jgi:outer membrane protein assembly factor BamB
MKLFHFLFLAFITAPVFSQYIPEKWTHFRGTQLDGVADDSNYPRIWNDSTNILWKTPVPGRGWSSPVVFGNQVWLTTATPDGKEMFALCTDLRTGEIVLNIKVFEPDTIFRIHAVNSYATPTPCIEEGFVYVHYGRYGTACINTRNGKIIWKRTDLQCEHVQGPGSSPILHKDKLILHLEGTDKQYLVALDKRSGETIWETHRPVECYEPLLEIGKKAYITPIVITVDRRELLISNGSAVCIAYDVETGEEVWRIVQGEDSTIAMPIFYNGILYFYTSFVTPPTGEKYCELLAVRPEGEGDVTDSHIIWRFASPMLQLLTPVINDGLIYTIDAKSIAWCLDASTGGVVWQNRMKGKFNASPIAASGNIYFSSTQGSTYVVKEGKTFELLSENNLDGEIWATPAFVDGTVLVRTSRFLYRFGEGR